jgi:hypothetical protein
VENQLSGVLRQLFALSEAYPDLKANTNFHQLQTELTDIENKIAAARRFTRCRNTTPASSGFRPRCSPPLSALRRRSSSISAKNAKPSAKRRR